MGMFGVTRQVRAPLSALTEAPPAGRPPTDRGVADRRGSETAQALMAREERLAYRWAIACAILMGILIRVWFINGADFPLNDGGLFYAMVQDLQRAHYELPVYTSYNGARIPFAYPPLAFYVAGFLDDLTPLTLLDVLRLLPLAVSSLTIGTFFLLSRSLVNSKLAVAGSVFAFAVLPDTFYWTLMGGGLTRSFGMLFMILTFCFATQMYKRRDRRYVVLTILAASGLVLSHLQWAWSGFYGVAILFLAFGRRREGTVKSAMVVAGTLALTAPWWVVMVGRYGVGVFGAALGTWSVWGFHEGALRLLTLQPTTEIFFPLVWALALLGVVVSLARREYLLPMWLLAVFLLQSRAMGQSAAIPIAMLAGVAIAGGLLPLTRRACGAAGASPAKQHNRLLAGLLIAMLPFTILTASLGGSGIVTPLPQSERDAMAWIAAHTPASSRFAVITGDNWAWDKSAEWFPVLANRVSVNIVQGSEWLPQNGFRTVIEANKTLQTCALRDAECVEEWLASTGSAPDFVYVTEKPTFQQRFAVIDDCCWPLRKTLRDHPLYHLVYENSGVAIYQRDASPALASAH